MTNVLIHKWTGGTKVRQFKTLSSAQAFINLRKLQDGPPAEIIEPGKAEMLSTLRASGWTEADLSTAGLL